MNTKVSSISQLVVNSKTLTEVSNGLAEYLLDYFAAEIGELFIPAIVKVPELILFEAEKMQKGRVEIAHMVAVANSAQPEFVGFAHDAPAFCASTGKPHGEAVRIMVSPVTAL